MSPTSAIRDTVLGLVGKTRDGRASVSVYLQPRSSKNKICGLHDGALKIAVTAPPVDGKANREAARYLASVLRLPPAHVTLVAGQQSRRKLFCVESLSEEELDARLQALLRG